MGSQVPLDTLAEFLGVDNLPAPVVGQPEVFLNEGNNAAEQRRRVVSDVVGNLPPEMDVSRGLNVTGGAGIELEMPHVFNEQQPHVDAVPRGSKRRGSKRADRGEPRRKRRKAQDVGDAPNFAELLHEAQGSSMRKGDICDGESDRRKDILQLMGR